MRPFVVAQRRDHARQRLDRVDDETSEIARVQVVRRTVHRHFPVHEAAQRDGQRGHVFGEHRRVRNDHDVAREPFAFACEKRLEARRTDLLFPFDDDLDVERQLAAHAQVRFERREVHQDLAFVIDAAASVHASVAHGRFEGRRLPELERILGLHVVVSVNQNRGRARRVQPRSVGDRQAVSLENFRFGQTGGAHARDDRFGGAAHLGVARRIRRNGRAGDPVTQFAQVAFAVRANEFDEFLRGDHCARLRVWALDLRGRQRVEWPAPVRRELVGVLAGLRRLPLESKRAHQAV